MTTPLHRATAAYKRAQAVTNQRRKELAVEIAKAGDAGMRQTEIVEITGYTREHIRRIIRDAEAG